MPELRPSVLKLAFCSKEAAKYATENWHYSRTMPACDTVRIGVWEDDEFIGVVVFGRGATAQLAGSIGLHHNYVCELCRVALKEHRSAVSRIVAIALKMLRKQCPKIKAVVSFAAQEQGHLGKIYQAGNWFYLGAKNSHQFIINGKYVHPRRIYSKYGKGAQSIAWLKKNIDPKSESTNDVIRHKYVYPFDRDVAQKLRSMIQPYPKRPKLCDGPSKGTAAVRLRPGRSNSEDKNAPRET